MRNLEFSVLLISILASNAYAQSGANCSDPASIPNYNEYNDKYYSFTIGQTSYVSLTMMSVTGNVVMDYDMYVLWNGSCPGWSEYDCAPMYGAGGIEVCQNQSLPVGTYYVFVDCENCYDSGHHNITIYTYAITTTTSSTSTTTTIPPVGTLYFEDFDNGNTWMWDSSFIFLYSQASAAQYYTDAAYRSAWDDYSYTSEAGSVYELENNFTYRFDPNTKQAVIFGFVNDIVQDSAASLPSNFVGMQVNNNYSWPVSKFYVRKNGTNAYSSSYIGGYGLYKYRVQIINETSFNVTVWKNSVEEINSIINQTATGLESSKVAIYSKKIESAAMEGSYRGLVDYFRIEDPGGITTTTTTTTTTTSSTTTTTTSSTSSTSTTTLVGAAEIHISTYYTLVTDNILVWAVARNGSGLADLGSSVSATVNGSGLTLYDDGTHGDLHAGDLVYSNYYAPTVEGIHRITLNVDGCVNTTDFDVINRSYLLVLTDFSRLYYEFLDTGATRTQDLNGDGIPDFYNLVERLMNYSRRYVGGGIVYDLAKEITTAEGFSADYADANYSDQAERRGMGSLVDAFISNVSEQSRQVTRIVEYGWLGYSTKELGDYLDFIAIVGDDEVVPYYRRTDPTGKESGTGNLADECDSGEGYVRWDLECKMGLLEDNATGNPALADTLSGYVLTDVPYASRSSQNPETVNKPSPDHAVGRIFAHEPNKLIQLVNAYETEVRVDEAGMFTHTDEFMGRIRDRATSALTEYLAESDVAHGPFVWGEWDALSSLNSTPLNYFITHANHMRFCTASCENDFITREDLEDVGWSAQNMLVTPACHSGFTVPWDKASSLTTNESRNAFNETLALNFMDNGVTYIAPTTYGWAYQSGLGIDIACWHDQMMAIIAKNLFSSATTGELLKYSLIDYNEGEYSWDDYDTLTMYSMHLYGLPTQELRGEMPRGSPVFGLTSGVVGFGAKPTVVISESGNLSLAIEIEVPAFVNESVGGAMVFTVPGAALTSEAGGPVLPVISALRLMPKTVEVVSVNLTGFNVSQVVENVTLLNVTPMVLSTQETGNASANISDPYPGVQFYYNVTEWGGGLLLRVYVIPLQYNVSQSNVALFDHVSLSVEYLLPNETVGDPELVIVSLNTSTVLAGELVELNANVSSPGEQNASLTYSLIDESASVITTQSVALNLSNGSTIVQFTVNTSGFDPGVKSVSVSLAIPSVGVIASESLELEVQGIFVDVAYGTGTASITSEVFNLNITILDENGAPVSGLSNNSFLAYVNQDQTNVSVVEVAPGVYAANVDISDLSEGTYTLTVYGIDTRGVYDFRQLQLTVVEQQGQTYGLIVGWNLISLPLLI